MAKTIPLTEDDMTTVFNLLVDLEDRKDHHPAVDRAPRATEAARKRLVAKHIDEVVPPDTMVVDLPVGEHAVLVTRAREFHKLVKRGDQRLGSKTKKSLGLTLAALETGL